MLGPLRWLVYQGNRAFTWLWWSQTISLFGSQVTIIAIPLLAAVSLRASALEMGLLAAVETVPYLALSIPAGVLVDRVDRRRLLIVSNVLRAVLLLAIPAAAVVGYLTLPLLYAVSFGIGALSVVFDVAYQSYVPELLDPAELLRGNQRIELSESAARTVGPGVGGALVAVAGGAAAIVVDAISYLVASLALLGARNASRLRPEGRPASAPAVAAPGQPGFDIWEYARALDARVADLEARMTAASVRRRESSAFAGLRLVLGDRVLRDMAISTALFNLASSAIVAIFVLYAVNDARMDATGVGILYGAGNVGFVLGALAVGAVTARVGTGPTLILSAIGGAIATLILPFATGPLAVPLLFAGRFVGALTIPLFNVNARALRQSRAPLAALGRVNSVFRLIDWGTLPVGALLGGWVGTTYGLHETLVVAAVLGVLSAVWLLPSPLWRVRVLATPDAPEPSPGSPRTPEPAPRTRGPRRRVVAGVTAVLSGPAAAVSRVPSIRWAWLAIGGAAVQVAISIPAVNTQLGQSPPFLYVLSSAAVLVCLLANLRLPGIAIAAVGGGLNLVAILANGGRMPIDPEAARMVGQLPPTGYSHTIETTSAYLRGLTDIIVVPPPLPFANVYSLGDLVLVVGLAITLASALHGWPVETGGGAARPHGSPSESTGPA